MKKSFLKIAGACFLAIALNLTAWADPINGEISFHGGYVVDNSNLSLATQFSSFNGVTANQGTGDYASATGAAVTMSGFSFASFPAGGVLPQWQLTLTPTTSFDLLSISIDFQNATTLVLSGSGMAHMAGKDNYVGAWNLTANTFGTTFSFSGGTSVPDSGTTALLLGLGLVGISLVSRRRKVA